MRSARRQHRAAPNRIKSGSARRFAECLALLYAGTAPTPEQAAAIEREAAHAPYREQRQRELELQEAVGER